MNGLVALMWSRHVRVRATSARSSDCIEPVVLDGGTEAVHERPLLGHYKSHIST